MSDILPLDETPNGHAFNKALVRIILERSIQNTQAYNWSVQGLGMYRLLLTNDKRIRMHVWDPGAAVPNVSKIHTHPWHFKSTIVSRKLIDYRYSVSGISSTQAKVYRKQEIICGPGGCAVGDAPIVFVKRDTRQRYVEGESYNLNADEFHMTVPEQGTITIIERTFLEDTEHAFVLYPDGEKWVSAEPRKATEDEVVAMAKMALEKMA